MRLKKTAVKFLQILIVLLLNLLIISFSSSSYFSTSVEAFSKTGSTGSEVREIQTRLKKWGYYSGSVDGIYGTATKNAVIYFQKKNGLTVDGIVGAQTLRALGISSSSGYGGYTKTEYNLLARLISAEARGESMLGQVAVGAVVLNRVDSPSFPDTIAGVIYQPGAFSCLDNGQFNITVQSSAYTAAQYAMNGWDPTYGALYYYNPKTAQSSWLRAKTISLTIGNHVFCK